MLWSAGRTRRLVSAIADTPAQTFHTGGTAIVDPAAVAFARIGHCFLQVTDKTPRGKKLQWGKKSGHFVGAHAGASSHFVAAGFQAERGGAHGRRWHGTRGHGRLRAVGLHSEHTVRVDLQRPVRRSGTWRLMPRFRG